MDPVTKRLVVWQELLSDNQTASESFMNSDAIRWSQIGLENLKNSYTIVKAVEGLGTI